MNSICEFIIKIALLRRKEKNLLTALQDTFTSFRRKSHSARFGI